MTKKYANSTRGGHSERPRRQHISFPVIREIHGRLAAAILDGGDLATAAKAAELQLRTEINRVRTGHQKGASVPSF